MLRSSSQIGTLIGFCLGLTLVSWCYLGPLASRDLTRYEGQPRDPNTPDGAFSLRDVLEDATISYGESSCTQWRSNRWTCPNFEAAQQWWLWVGRYQGRITTPDGPEWRQCVWAHPHTENGRAVPLRIRFERLPTAERLFGEIGLLDSGRAEGPVDLSVQINGSQRRRVHLSRRADTRKWHPWSVSLNVQSEAIDVVFEISTRDASWRHICLTAFLGAEEN